MMIQELPESEDQDDRVIRAAAAEQEAGSRITTMSVGPSLTATIPAPSREQFDQLS